MRLVRVIAAIEPGGAQLAVLRLTRALSVRGIESTVYAGSATADGRRLFARHGVRLETWNGGPNLQYRTSDEFADWLRPRLKGADVVHAHMFGAWWAAARAALPDTPLLASEHNAIRWPGAPLLEEMREALSRVDLFFACGPSVEALVADLGLPVNRLRQSISPIGATESRPRSDLPVPRVVFAGRLHPEKGPDVLIEAVARMTDPPPTYILGSGPAERELRRLVRSRGLEGQVRFVGWQDDVASWIAGASACVVPSRHEAWSQSAVLAMALGVPVVGTAVEGLPITLGENRGVLVEPEAPGALAAALEDVVAQRRLPDLSGARVYARSFSVDRVADLYAGAYREVSRPVVTLAG